MAQWGNTDQSNNSPIWTPARFDLAPNTANRDNLFNNSTPNAFSNGETVGVYGVSNDEVAGSGKIGNVLVVDPGNSFDEIANIDVDNTGVDGSDFAANLELELLSATVNAAGSGYALEDEVEVESNAATNAVLIVSAIETIASQNVGAFNDTGANGTFVGGSDFDVGDEITLEDGTVVNVTSVSANSVDDFDVVSKSTDVIRENNPTLSQSSTTGFGTGFSLTLGNNNQAVASLDVKNRGSWVADPAAVSNVAASGGEGSDLTVELNLRISKVNVTNAGSGYTAAPALTVNTAGSGTGANLKAEFAPGGRIAHAGWVLKREGTGGRAGRVQYETLVAGGLGSDADSDSIPE